MTESLIHVVRHAQAAADDPNSDLSALGIEQAKHLGRRFSTGPPAIILHSKYRRAEHTATIIGQEVGIVPQLSEFADDLTPFPTDADTGVYPERLLPWFENVPASERDPGGERLDRAFAELLELSISAGSPGILVVTHSFVIGWMVQRLLGLETPGWLGFASDNTGLTTLRRREDGTLTLVRFNDTGHL